MSFVGSGPRRRTAAPIVTVLSLAVSSLAVSGCSRPAVADDATSASTTTIDAVRSDSSTDRTGSCAALVTQFASVLAEVTTSSTGPAADDWISTVRSLDAMTSVWPMPARAAWTAYVDELARISSILSVVDVSRMKDPPQVQEYVDSLADLDDAGHRRAMDEIAAHLDARCPN